MRDGVDLDHSRSTCSALVSTGCSAVSGSNRVTMRGWWKLASHLHWSGVLTQGSDVKTKGLLDWCCSTAQTSFSMSLSIETEQSRGGGGNSSGKTPCSPQGHCLCSIPA